MANAEQQAVRPPREGEQGESDGLHISPWQITSALIGGAALFAGLAVFMGFLYLRTFLGDLGVPARVLMFTPYQYALASSPLTSIAGLYSVFALWLVLFWRYSRERDAPSRPNLGAVPLGLVRGVLAVAVMLLMSATIVAGPLSGEVLPHLSEGGLRALTVAIWASLLMAIVAAPVVVVFAPPHGSATQRLVFTVACALFLFWAVVMILPMAFGHLDARRTLDADVGTERATLLLVSDAGVEGPWSSAEDGRIENAQVIFICEDYIYFLYRSTADADSPTVHAIAADLVSRIDFFPER